METVAEKIDNTLLGRIKERYEENLPAHWKLATLGEVFKWGSGGTPLRSNPNYYGGEIPWLIIGDLNDDVVTQAATTITEEGLANSSARWVEKGSVLLAMYGSIGKLGIAGKRLTTNQAIAFTNPDPHDTKYLFYYLMSARGDLASLGKGATQKNISQAVIKNYPFPLAPLPDQRRIVEAIERQLGRLEAGVARLQAAKARLKRYKQAVLKAAYTGQLFIDDADMSDDAQLPEGWRWGTLGDFVRIRNGFAFKSTDYLEEGVLLIRQSNLGGERVTTEGAKYLPPSYLDYHKDFQVKKGDILIGMSGSIGKLCTYDLDEPALQNQRTGLLQFKDASQKPWVWNYLPMLEHALLKQGKGVAVLNISAKQIEASPMPIAPAEVQSMIIDEVEQRMTTIAETESTLDAQLLQAGRLRQAVLKRAFEGRLV